MGPADRPQTLRPARGPGQASQTTDSATSAQGDVKPRISCGGLERDVELRAVADAVELDPVGVRQPVVPVAGGGARPRQQPVRRAPHDPHGAGRSARRRGSSPSRIAWSIIARRGLAARRAAHLVGEQLGRDVLEVRRSMYSRRPPPALRRGHDRLGVRRRRLQQLAASSLKTRASPCRTRRRAPSRRPARARRPSRPAARGELQRDVAAERVADDVRRLEARLVHRRSTPSASASP